MAYAMTIDAERVQAHRLIEAVEVAKVLPMGTTIPASERVARELAPLKNEPAKMRAAWSQATASTPTPTAREVRAVVSELVTENKARAERKSALR